MTHTPDALHDPAGDNMYADPDATGIRGDNPYTDPDHTGVPDDNLYTHPTDEDETGNIYSDPGDTSHMRSTDQINAGIFEGDDEVDEHGNAVVTERVAEDTAVEDGDFDSPDYGNVVNPGDDADGFDAPTPEAGRFDAPADEAGRYDGPASDADATYDPTVEEADEFDVARDEQRDELGREVDDLGNPIPPLPPIPPRF